ncbi:MAG: Urea carboxylase [uncultured Solirubrobacteraceae bacterium]|uniref:Urea carboxylase n=1 Tax=uncultured Solirubrobacteraceae bacterium TaxID=1162706 RepID=A0A6J4RYM3_9ACTN|nr:MAG: Urea carboxylase [uncultured Solirubrobacteraceae bacterium]
MSSIEVLTPGTMTTIQDWPGRTGYWGIGVPPSGPMDDYAFRMANCMVGNPEDAAGLEVTLTGPKLRFAAETVVAVTGAVLPVKLDGELVTSWEPFTVPAGGELRLGAIKGIGMRAYLAIGGGFAAQPELGSRSTFTLARMGGHHGRALAKGDVLVNAGAPTGPPVGGAIPPLLSNAWDLHVIHGPHGAPDFLTSDGADELWSATWEVHHHSDRSGIRLVGNLPDFARSDGGDAGLHPSNILDSAYGIGTIMLAGDMAVAVGPDGPSLGGFGAVAQVIEADCWKLGQLPAGDEVRLVPVSIAVAALRRQARENELAGIADAAAAAAGPMRHRPPTPVLEERLDGAGGPVTYRLAGDRTLLVEFGDPVLDLRSRVRAHLLMEALGAEGVRGIRDLTPGVRSLHVHHDPRLLSTSRLLDVLRALEATLPAPDDTVIANRVVHLPLTWRHSQVELAMERYARSVRADAPWCPDNIEFIRRINGLADEDGVRDVVTSASYMVLGLGDVYLGAPVAVPLDPRHRLVTTKYNPVRTWTPPNAVGIGGAFLCVYGVEGPGGYQLVGRTVPIWSRAPNAGDEPWVLRHFDELRFELVAEDDLETMREASDAGEWVPRMTRGAFSLAAHERFLREQADAIAEFRDSREAAFIAEREAWHAAA